MTRCDSAERQILQAKGEGPLEDLNGADTPLKMEGGNTTVAAMVRLAELELRLPIEQDVRRKYYRTS